jgi:general secretion pathway protein G
MVMTDRAPDQRGFTLIEMMIVIAIIGILASIALPQFRTSIVTSREAVLKEDLFRLRQAIDQYQADKGVYPPSLDTLVEEGYIRSIQPDPFTRAPDWQIVLSEPDPSAPDQAPGVYDVHSASEELSLSGEPYKEW